MPTPLVSAIGYVLMPALAATRAFTTSGTGGTAPPADALETRAMLTRAVLASAGLAAAILVPIAAVAPWLVPAVFGPAYRAAVPLLWILTPGGIFLACGQVVANVLRGLGRQRVVAWAEGVTVVFTIVLLCSLVPVIGVAGAAIASTIPYGISLALMIRGLNEGTP